MPDFHDRREDTAVKVAVPEPDAGRRCFDDRQAAPSARVALVHDYLTQRGGAERVVLSLLKAFPSAPLFTALYSPEATFPQFAHRDIRTLWTNHLRFLRENHRRGLLIYPYTFGNLRIDADVVLCSSSAFAHGIRTTGRKVVYCYTPPRWLYGQSADYLAGWPRWTSLVVQATSPALRYWDNRNASSAETYLTSSRAQRDRIRLAYGIDAEVVHPPAFLPNIELAQCIPGIDPGFILCVSRLLTYKNVDAIIRAFVALPATRLIVVGIGPETNRLKALAGPNVSFLGRVDDLALAWLYLNCAGMVSASYEDYGLTPLEAAACGKPVAVLRFGGFLDTVSEEKTGVFFDAPTAAAIGHAIRQLLSRRWVSDTIIEHAAKFSESGFIDRIRQVVLGGGANPL